MSVLLGLLVIYLFGSAGRFVGGLISPALDLVGIHVGYFAASVLTDLGGYIAVVLFFALVIIKERSN